MHKLLKSMQNNNYNKLNNFLKVLKKFRMNQQKLNKVNYSYIFTLNML